MSNKKKMQAATGTSLAHLCHQHCKTSSNQRNQDEANSLPPGEPELKEKPHYNVCACKEVVGSKEQMPLLELLGHQQKSDSQTEGNGSSE